MQGMHLPQCGGRSRKILVLRLRAQLLCSQCESDGRYLFAAGESRLRPCQRGNAAPEGLVVGEARLERHKHFDLLLRGVVWVFPCRCSPDGLLPPRGADLLALLSELIWTFGSPTATHETYSCRASLP